MYKLRLVCLCVVVYAQLFGYLACPRCSLLWERRFYKENGFLYLIRLVVSVQHVLHSGAAECVLVALCFLPTAGAAVSVLCFEAFQPGVFGRQTSVMFASNGNFPSLPLISFASARLSRVVQYVFPSTD